MQFFEKIEDYRQFTDILKNWNLLMCDINEIMMNWNTNKYKNYDDFKIFILNLFGEIF